MLPPVAVREFPQSVFRVGRAEGVIHYTEIDAVDASNVGQGGRFDVVGGGVLYCATTKVGAYKEVLSSFRPSAKIYRVADHESLMAQGSIPKSWRERRRLANFSLKDPLPFVDVESDVTLTRLTKEIAEELDELGSAMLDASVVRGSNRLLTRAIAKWVYTQVDEAGGPLYGGIRYLSRFQSHECWAVFRGNVLDRVHTSPIVHTDAELNHVARVFAITLH